MVYAQPSSCPGEWHTQNPMRLSHTNGSPNLSQKTRPYSNQQKKENLQNFGFADHTVKLKESEK